MGWSQWNTSWGALYVCIEEHQICALSFEREDEMRDFSFHPLGEECAQQIEEYIQGKRKAFSLPLALKGSPFQRAVWEETCKIPYGETRCYGDIGRALGKPKGARAVGQALNKNPLLILIPCHRVIGRDGSLTGFGGGLSWKKRLLQLEGFFIEGSYVGKP